MTTASDAPGPTGAGATTASKNRMERVIDGSVTGIVVPMITNGIAFAIFAVLWIAFVAAIVWSPESLDAAWAWVATLPIIVQAVVWLLFLPVVVGLWVWETTWPLDIRLIVIIALAAWSLVIFLPRSAAPSRDETSV